MRPHTSSRPGPAPGVRSSHRVRRRAFRNAACLRARRIASSRQSPHGTVRYDRSNPRPQVLIVDEYLLNFHPGANHDIEDYLESNGLEIIEARMTDVIRKTYFYQDAQAREFHVSQPLATKAFNRVANRLFETAHNVCDGIAKAHPLYEPACRMPELVRASDPSSTTRSTPAKACSSPPRSCTTPHAAAARSSSCSRSAACRTMWSDEASSSSSRNATPMRTSCRSTTTPMSASPTSRTACKCSSQTRRRNFQPRKRREHRHQGPGVAMARPRKSERDAAGIRLANAFWALLEHHRLANITVGMVAEGNSPRVLGHFQKHGRPHRPHHRGQGSRHCHSKHGIAGSSRCRDAHQPENGQIRAAHQQGGNISVKSASFRQNMCDDTAARAEHAIDHRIQPAASSRIIITEPDMKGIPEFFLSFVKNNSEFLA